MTTHVQTNVLKICREHDNDRTRLVDIARAVQAEFGRVGEEATDLIAGATGIPRVEVESLVSFYSFLSSAPKGEHVIRLSDDVVDRMAGYDKVKEAFEDELGIRVGETTPDGRISLERTACIGMCDQAPAAIVNNTIVRKLRPGFAREIVAVLRGEQDEESLPMEFGDGNNAHKLVQSVVLNNIRQAGPIIFSPLNRGEAIRKALAMSPMEVIRAVKTARLRGRGGAGFPCGMKWEFTRASGGDDKVVICNADEGEPGTFKDRVILTEIPDRVFAGMTIAAYAIGASEGILYLRAEYDYLRKFLDAVLQKRRGDGLLGKSILGRKGFDFDIRIQMGAGAYVCGEETALISSCEGQRGDPKNRPPFPAQRGYLGRPTSVNNVETLSCVTKIMEEGPASYCEHGTPASSGTKLLSISGDCHRPGVYEVEFGISLREVLELCEANDAAAVQVGGPSGQLVGPADFDRKICFDDLATGGALIVFDSERDLLEFFEDESCGYCTPCRVGTVLLRRCIGRILEGRGEPSDLDQLERIAGTMKSTSRCGLGQTAGNPVLSTLEKFRGIYDSRVKADPEGLRRAFDLSAAVKAAEGIVGRESVHAGQ